MYGDLRDVAGGERISFHPTNFPAVATPPGCQFCPAYDTSGCTRSVYTLDPDIALDLDRDLEVDVDLDQHPSIHPCIQSSTSTSIFNLYLHFAPRRRTMDAGGGYGRGIRTRDADRGYGGNGEIWVIWTGP